MAVQMGHALGAKVCNALGIDAKRVSRIVVTLQVGDIVTVDVTYLDIDGDALVETLKTYELSERE